MTQWLNDLNKGFSNISTKIEQQASGNPCLSVHEGTDLVCGDSLHWMMCIEYQLGQNEGSAHLGV